MKSHRNSEEVVEGLGGKVVDALGAAIPRTRLDLARYQALLPDIVATSSSRGLANWFHDRIWFHVVSDLESLDNIVIVDKGPIREIVVDGLCRIRVKRHDKKGQVSTYPTLFHFCSFRGWHDKKGQVSTYQTQSALEFLAQPPEQLVLDGLAEVHLIAGYQWNPTTHEIGPAVLSLRDGRNNVIWMIELPDPATGAPVVDITGPRTPEIPAIEFSSSSAGEAEVRPQ